MDERAPFYYKAFGMNIASDIHLPELEMAHGRPDVRIIYGKTPDEIPGDAVRKGRYQAAPNHFLFHVPHVSRYSVTNGDCIVVEPDQPVEPEAVRLFLLGTSLGALLIQRGVLPIHGSAVVINGKVVIITGESGAGKSTLLAAFRERGACFLTDDIAAVTFDGDGTPWVQSGYPQQKLWRDSAEKIGVDVSVCKRIRSGIEKYAIVSDEGFYRSAAPLAAVCELQSSHCPMVTLDRLTELESLKVLMRHTYRPHLMSCLGTKATHFRQCSALLKHIAVSRLTRPEGVFSISEQVELVERQMAKAMTGGSDA